MTTPIPRTSAPAQRALESQGIACLEQLSTYRASYILSLHGVGPKAVRILAAALHETGLAFAPEEK